MAATPETIPVKQFRGHLSDVTDAVAQGRRLVVTRNGKPRMALVPVADLELLRAIEDLEDVRAIQERAEHPNAPWDEGLRRSRKEDHDKPVSPGMVKARPHLRRGTITLSDLRMHRDEILDLAARHGAGHVRVFGSVARGSAGPESDIDLLVEIARDRSLLDQIALIQDLSELLDRRVDVISDRGLNPRVEQRVLEEAVPL
jgi:prevent-host-death family protein